MPRGLLIMLLIVGLVLCSFSANYMYDKKVALAPSEAKAPVQFYAGMDKFLSNVAWMTFIQWSAEANVDKDRSEAVYRKLNALTDLDPLLTEAYLNGAMSIAPYRPDLAKLLLDKAILMGLDNNWKVDYYAGMLDTQYLHDADSAEGHLKRAAELPDAPWYVTSALLQCREKEMGQDHMSAIGLWYDLYNGTNENQTELHRAAASHVIDLGTNFINECDTRLPTTTDDKDRQEILSQRGKVQKIVDTVVGHPATMPSPQDQAT
jgi:hypothetical protein